MAFCTLYTEYAYCFPSTLSEGSSYGIPEPYYSHSRPDRAGVPAALVRGRAGIPAARLVMRKRLCSCRRLWRQGKYLRNEELRQKLPAFQSKTANYSKIPGEVECVSDRGQHPEPDVGQDPNHSAQWLFRSLAWP